MSSAGGATISTLRVLRGGCSASTRASACKHDAEPAGRAGNVALLRGLQRKPPPPPRPLVAGWYGEPLPAARCQGRHVSWCVARPRGRCGGAAAPPTRRGLQEAAGYMDLVLLRAISGDELLTEPLSSTRAVSPPSVTPW